MQPGQSEISRVGIGIILFDLLLQNTLLHSININLRRNEIYLQIRSEFPAGTRVGGPVQLPELQATAGGARERERYTGTACSME